MARADRDRERVDARLLDELDRLLRIGEVHLPRAVPVLAPPAERAELALDGDAARVGISTTSFVTATLYSKSAGVLPSASSEPSIITLVKPISIAEMQVAGSLPWSWCSATGISG